jgi:SAM-dependent methyltransferase
VFYSPSQLGAWAVVPPPRGFKRLYLQSFGIPDVRAQLTATYLTRVLESVPARTILDVGCGNGWFPCMAAASNPDTHVVGWDRDGASIHFADRVARQRGLRNVRFEVVDFECDPINGRFDWISCAAVLQFIRDVPKAVSRFSTLLEPGGHLVLQLPLEPSVRVFMRSARLARRLPGFSEARGPFTLDESYHLMRDAGLDIVQMDAIIKGPTAVAKELFYLAASIDRRLSMALAPVLNWTTVFDPWYPGRGNGLILVARKPQ